MDDLTEFLLARIADDEERLSSRFRRPHWRGCEQYANEDSYQSGFDDCDCHLDRQLLAECEAKQRIVAETVSYSPELEHGDNGEWAFDRVLHLLALPYADHPDYREDWRP